MPRKRTSSPSQESDSMYASDTASLPSGKDFETYVENARQNVKEIAKAETAGELVGDDVLNFRLKCRR